MEGQVSEESDNGSYDKPYIPKGFKYKEGTWNNGYTIIQEGIENEFVWVPCVSNQEKVKEGDNVVTFGKILPTTNSTTDPYVMYKELAITVTGEEGETASEIEESVGKYGGFYIAKYEAGIEGEQDNYSLPTKTGLDVKPLSKSGLGVWNGITAIDAAQVSKNMIDTKTTGAKSALISGAVWDTTLQWIVTTSDKKDDNINVQFDINSEGKGWYNNVSSNNLNRTGYYQVNNIYDMAGNMIEWTTERCTGGSFGTVVTRGGCYLNPGRDYPAAIRCNASDIPCAHIGFRVVMYK